VLIFGIDGCRPDALQAADTPALDSLAATGAYSFTAQACRETKSGPSWTSVLTGVWPDKHGVTNNSLEGEHFSEFPHFFSRLKSVSPEAFTASFVHWAPIHDKIVRSADRSNKYASDVEVAAESVFLLQSACPDVIFLHFDDYGSHDIQPPVYECLERFISYCSELKRSGDNPELRLIIHRGLEAGEEVIL